MDPNDVREERVSTGSYTTPAESTGAYAAPVESGPPPAPGGPAYVPVAPRAVAPVTTSAQTTVTRGRGGPSPTAYRINQMIWLLAGIVDALLALHFIFRAVGARNTGFAHYIYRIGGYLASPFEGIFNNTAANGVAVIHWADVLAIVVYTAAAWIITKLVKILAGPRAAGA